MSQAIENKPTLKIELGIEFLFSLLVFFFPYGAEQMGFKPNFWLGAVCLLIGAMILVRMFWIFPMWTSRLTKLEKGLISFIVVALLLFLFRKPISIAYGKRNTESEPKEQPRIVATPPPSIDAPKPDDTRLPKSGQPKLKKPAETKPKSPPPVQNCPNGNCIGGDNNGTAIVNNNFAPKLEITEAQRAIITSKLKQSLREIGYTYDKVHIRTESDELEVGVELEHALYDAGVQVAAGHYGKIFTPGGPTYSGISLSGVNATNKPIADAIESSLIDAKVVDGPLKRMLGDEKMELEVIVRKP